MKKSIKIAVGIILGLVLLLGIFAKMERISPLAWGHAEINTPAFSDEAINGFDAVAFHTQNKAVKGTEVHLHRWKGADWKFASAENLRLFKEDPAQYAPQFGGYCAFAVSKGFTANPVDRTFGLVEGKLYLFADETVKSEWMANSEANLAQSLANWQ